MLTILLTLTFSLIALFSGRKAYRAWLRTTEPRIKVNRSAVRARASTTLPTPPSSRLGQAGTESGPAGQGSGSVDTPVVWKAFAQIAVPDVPTVTSISVKPGLILSVPEQGGVTYSSFHSNSAVPLPPRDEDVLP